MTMMTMMRMMTMTMTTMMVMNIVMMMMMLMMMAVMIGQCIKNHRQSPDDSPVREARWCSAGCNSEPHAVVPQTIIREIIKQHAGGSLRSVRWSPMLIAVDQTVAVRDGISGVVLKLSIAGSFVFEYRSICCPSSLWRRIM